MMQLLSENNHYETFIAYLNGVIEDHYGALYSRKRYSPIDDTLLEANSLLGCVLFAAGGHYPFPRNIVERFSIDAQTKLLPGQVIYEKWNGLSIEGAVSEYCDYIDKVVLEAAFAKAPNRLFISCPLSPRRPEIIERLYHELRKAAENADNSTPQIEESGENIFEIRLNY